MDYRQFLEMHNNCTKALANDKAKMPFQNIDVDTGLYGLYTKFQVAYPARLAHLRSGNFQESVEPGRDKCVPPLLQKFSQKCKAGGAQPPGNYSATSSCSFGPDRIAEYEKANVEFKNDMRMSGPVSIPKLRALLEHDIAYFHLRIVKWKPKEAAHLAGKAQQDDDDPPISIPDFPRQFATFFPGTQIAPVGISDPTFSSRSDLWYVPTLRTFLLYKCFFYSEVRAAQAPV